MVNIIMFYFPHPDAVSLINKHFTDEWKPAQLLLELYGYNVLLPLSSKPERFVKWASSNEYKLSSKLDVINNVYQKQFTELEASYENCYCLANIEQSIVDTKESYMRS